MDRPQLADFLRRRREALQPGDVGLGAGARRRTHHSRVYAAGMRAILARDTTDERARDLVEQLQQHSPEFRALWAEHEIAVTFSEQKRVAHPNLGLLELWCQVLINADEGQVLLVYTATPGTESHDKLRLLGVTIPGSTLRS